MGKGLRGERVGVPWMNPTVWNKNTTACSPQGLGIGKGELPQHAFTLGCHQISTYVPMLSIGKDVALS